MVTRRGAAIETMPAFTVKPVTAPVTFTVTVIGDGDCPECAADRRSRTGSDHLGFIGVVELGHHRVWIDHTRHNALGQRQSCPASGVALCVARQLHPRAVDRPPGWHLAPTCLHPRT